MYTYRDGAVISGGFQKTVTVIHDSVFQNNTAKKGGVFNVADQSVIKCFN